MATAVLAVELLALGTAGCWDRTEINDVAMVEGVGFDAAPNGGVTLTASIVLPSGIPGIGGTAGGGGAGTGPTSTVVSASGATIGAAQSQLQESVPAIIFWGQTRVVVIGQALARRGIAEEVGFFLRERIARPRASFFVTQGEAGKILQGSSPFRSIASANIIENAMLRLQPSMAAYRVGQLLMQPGASFLLPEVELQQSNPPGPVPQSGGGGGGGQAGSQGPHSVIPMQFRLAGAGLFKDGRLVGWMAPAQARGALWLLGTATRGTVTVQTPEGATVTMSLDSAHIARRAVLRDGSPAVVIEIVARDSLLDVQGGPLRLDKAGTADELGRLLAQRIIERAGEALAQAQSMDVDVFNFGDLIASYQPRAWRVMAATWPAAFAQIPVTIQAKGVVKGTGNLTNVPSSG